MVKSPFKIKSPFKGGSPFAGLRRRNKAAAGPDSATGNKAWMESAADRFYAERDAATAAAADPSDGSPSPVHATGGAAAAAGGATSIEQRWRQYRQEQAKPAAADKGSRVWTGVKGLALLGGATLLAFVLPYRAAMVGEGGR